MTAHHGKTFGDGYSDDLEPIYPIDVAAHGSVSALLREFKHTAFGGRALGEGVDILESMVRDPECLVVLTVTGAMTVAKQGLVICEMLDRGWVQAVVTTGAMMAHGLVEGSGRTHFKHNPRLSDHELYERGYDRVYDTLELEQNLDDIDVIVRQVLDTIPEGTALSSELVFREIGRHLVQTTSKETRAILKSAFLAKVPVYVPAFTDSEIGLDVALMNHMRVREGKPARPFDPYLDLASYARLAGGQTRTGIFTIGGGAPRNWAQQLGPLLDLLQRRAQVETTKFRFHYGVRVCPEPVHFGGLSGCTYSEGVSWGKFVPVTEGGRYAEILSDATVVWPLMVRALIERFGDQPVKKQFRQPTFSLLFG